MNKKPILRHECTCTGCMIPVKRFEVSNDLETDDINHPFFAWKGLLIIMSTVFPCFTNGFISSENQAYIVGITTGIIIFFLCESINFIVLEERRK